MDSAIKILVDEISLMCYGMLMLAIVEVTFKTSSKSADLFSSTINTAVD